MTAKRQIVLDTETTGIDPNVGHRIIEIGCVELIDRKLTGNNYHQYINPEREIDAGAIEVHGITNEFLFDKPVYADIAEEFYQYIKGAELVIHNAPFDVGFMDAEFAKLGGQYGKVADYCAVLDTLALARAQHPGQRNSLDALCKRYDIDNSHRTLHGALLDAEILSDVYLLMTGGQVDLALAQDIGRSASGKQAYAIRRLSENRPKTPILKASDEELAAHEAKLDTIEKLFGKQSLWRSLPDETC